MDQNNLEYLQRSLDYLGFGTRLNMVLESAMQKGERTFSIGANQRYIPAEFRTTEEKQFDQMHFELKFARSAKGDVYFLNAMETSLTRYNGGDPIVKQFELDQQNRVSALQAYKLLCGLSFEKPIFVQDLNDLEGKKYKKVNAWIKLDLHLKASDGEPPMRFYLPEHGFDLVKAFKAYPFNKMLEEEKINASLQSLRFGNRILLPLEISGKLTQVYVSANPADRDLDIFDEQMRRISEKDIKCKTEPPSLKENGERVTFDQVDINSERLSKGIKR